MQKIIFTVISGVLIGLNFVPAAAVWETIKLWAEGAWMISAAPLAMLAATASAYATHGFEVIKTLPLPVIAQWIFTTIIPVSWFTWVTKGWIWTKIKLVAAWAYAKTVGAYFARRFRKIGKTISSTWSSEPWKVLAVAGAFYMVIRQVFKYREWRRLRKNQRQETLDRESVDVLMTSFFIGMASVAAFFGGDIASVVGKLRTTTWIRHIFDTILGAGHKFFGLFQNEDTQVIPDMIAHKGHQYELKGAAAPGDPDIVVGRNGTMYQRREDQDTWTIKQTTPNSIKFAGCYYVMEEEGGHYATLDKDRELVTRNSAAKIRAGPGKGRNDHVGLGYEYEEEDDGSGVGGKAETFDPKIEGCFPFSRNETFDFGFLTDFLKTQGHTNTDMLFEIMLGSALAIPVMNKARKFWDKLTPEQKKTFSIVLMGCSLGLLYFLMVDLKANKRRKETTWDLADELKITKNKKLWRQMGDDEKSRREKWADFEQYVTENKLQYTDQIEDMVAEGGYDFDRAYQLAMENAYYDFEKEVEKNPKKRRGHRREALSLPAQLLEKFKAEFERQRVTLHKQKDGAAAALELFKTQQQNIKENNVRREQVAAEQVSKQEEKVKALEQQIKELENSKLETQKREKVLVEKIMKLEENKKEQAKKETDTVEEPYLEYLRAHADDFYTPDELNILEKSKTEDSLYNRAKRAINAQVEKVLAKVKQGKEIALEEMQLLKEYTTGANPVDKEAKLPNLKIKATVRDRINSAKQQLKENGVKVPRLEIPDHIRGKQKNDYILEKLEGLLKKAKMGKEKAGQGYKLVEEAPQLGSEIIHNESVFYGYVYDGKYYKSGGAVGNYFVTCMHHIKKDVGETVTVGKFTDADPMTPVVTEEVLVTHVFPDSDVMFCEKPKKIMKNVRSYRPKEFTKGQIITVTVDGVAVTKDKKWGRSSGKAYADGRHYAATEVGWSGTTVRDAQGNAYGVHIQGPTTDDPHNTEPNTYRPWNGEMFAILNPSKN